MYLPLNQILCGDSLEVLKTLPDNSVDSCITSPPYFNLRDYGIDGQIGLENTWQEYIGKLIAVFDEVKRVLKKEGTCFVNLSDSYSGSGGGRNTDVTPGKTKGFNKNNRGTQTGIILPANARRAKSYDTYDKKYNKEFQEIQAKSQMAIPARFQIAMIDAGWLCRNDFIWIKPNAIPESVQDRWKKAHEYIFFFVKYKNYYFNLDAIRTPYKQVSINCAKYQQGRNALGINSSSVGEKYGRDKNNRDALNKYVSMPTRQVKLNPLGACPPDFLVVNTNCSEDDTQKEHFATYPKALITPFVKAGCPYKGVILDPFAGTSTTAIVARHFNKQFIMIELNPKYVEAGEKRLAQQSLI